MNGGTRRNFVYEETRGEILALKNELDVSIDVGVELERSIVAYVVAPRSRAKTDLAPGK